MDNAKRHKKQGSFKRGVSDSAKVPSAEEALNQYYERMSALDHKLNKNVEKQRMRRQGLKIEDTEEEDEMV